MVTTLVFTVFILVYVGMVFGGLPFLQLDRTGIALLGAIVLVATQAMSVDDAFRSMHAPTLLLLFSFMVVSAQLRLGGFYAWVACRVGAFDSHPSLLLGAVIAVSAVLSAIFSNDVVCLAMAPVIAEICLARRLNPTPFLIGLACSANIGSAATLIGNPQNMLIGQTLKISFGEYVGDASGPVALSLLITWGAIVISRRKLGWDQTSAGSLPDRDSHIEAAGDLDLWQTSKGLLVATVLLGAFLFSSWPHELVALAGAGLLLTSRRLHSHRMLGLVDWQLLILFMGLFVVNHAIQQTGLPSQAVDALAASGFNLMSQGTLFLTSFALSNIVSNVPAVMLLLPMANTEHAGTILALSSTLAGNLLIVGSIANIIVVTEAARKGIVIGWKEHAKLGVPITIATSAAAGIWLWVTSA